MVSPKAKYIRLSASEFSILEAQFAQAPSLAGKKEPAEAAVGHAERVKIYGRAREGALVILELFRVYEDSILCLKTMLRTLCSNTVFRVTVLHIVVVAHKRSLRS